MVFHECYLCRPTCHIVRAGTWIVEDSIEVETGVNIDNMETLPVLVEPHVPAESVNPGDSHGERILDQDPPTCVPGSGDVEHMPPDDGDVVMAAESNGDEPNQGEPNQDDVSSEPVVGPDGASSQPTLPSSSKPISQDAKLSPTTPMVVASSLDTSSEIPAPKRHLTVIVQDSSYVPIGCERLCFEDFLFTMFESE